MKESEIIENFFLPIANNNSSLNLKDDAAFFDEYVITKDIICQNIHFFKDDKPDLIAKKLLRVNLSDIAAMGAVPKYYILGLVIPKNTTKSWLELFSKGLKEDIDLYGGELIGGDTVVADKLTLSITAIGKTKNPILKSNAKLGDNIYVTGTIGDSYLGLQHKLQNTHNEYLINRYHLPIARVNEAQQIKKYANAMTDISDGLVIDLKHLCKASNINAEIDLNDVPISKEAKKMNYDIEDLVSGGDDYELLFTANPKYHHEIINLGNITKIGNISEKFIIKNQKKDIKGFEHNL